MSRALDDLSPVFRKVVFEFLARTVELRIPVIIVDTLRTKAEQAANIAAGVSWTSRSKHLADSTGGANAIDIVPRSVLGLKGWAPSHQDWLKLGELGESLGLRWGGRWKQKDMGHFEAK